MTSVHIDTSSLSKTVDAIHDALFYKQALSAEDRKRVALWIAGRQGLEGAYAGTFAGFADERAKGIALFTGERITSASARHILGEEACRALQMLRVRERVITTALSRAEEGLIGCLERAAAKTGSNSGIYCCGKCSVGVWRHLLAGGLDRQEERLRAGVRYLRVHRAGEKKWRRFPFWYTVLALHEMDFPEASQELRYVASELEREAARTSTPGQYASRRRELAKRALSRI
jgi:hypothetical protein